MAYKTSPASPWSKIVLVSCWVIQTLISLIIIGLLSPALSVLQDDLYYYEYIGSTIYPVTVAFASISITLNIVEIVLFTKNNLSPKTYFAFQLVKTILWVIIFAMDIAILTMRNNYARIIHIIETSLMLLSILFSLTYSSILFHRHRRNLQRGIYYATPNPHQPNHLSPPPIENSQPGIAVMGSLRTENHSSIPPLQASEYPQPIPRQPPTSLMAAQLQPQPPRFMAEVSGVDRMPAEAGGREVMELSAKR